MHDLVQQADAKLQYIIGHVIQETKYYGKSFSVCEQNTEAADLSTFLLLNRQIIQCEHSRFLCNRYQRYPDIKRLILKRSLGWSGVPLEVYWDSRDDVQAKAHLWTYRKERFGITADEKCCIFRTAEYAGNKIMYDIPKRLSWDGRTLSFSMQNLSMERLQECVDSIHEFEPSWMILPPSIALMLVEFMEASNQSLPSSLRYMELCGEVIDVQAEAMIKEFFHVQTANIYATQAAGAVAASCAHGNLHIFSENAIVEVIRGGKSVIDEEGDIYITSLQNTAMPLIRMETGDKGILQSSPCPCGQSSPMIHLTRARDCSFVTTVSGRRVSAYMLRSMVEYTNEELSRCLAHIRFRQNDYDQMDVIMSVKPAFSGWEKEAARVFQEKIQDSALRQIQLNFIFEESYEPSENEMSAHPFFESWKGGNSDDN